MSDRYFPGIVPVPWVPENFEFSPLREKLLQMAIPDIPGSGSVSQINQCVGFAARNAALA
jgi:hypothetical protein